MTTRSQSTYYTRSSSGWSLLALLGVACVNALAQYESPLLKSCDKGAETVATVSSTDPVKIRFSFGGDSGTCYAVTATVDGKPVNGYFVNSRHPDIVAFEHELLEHVPQIPPAPPPPAPVAAPPSPSAIASGDASKTAATSVAAPVPQEAPKPVSFAGFRAVDVNGNRVDFSAKRTPNIVVYFWSAASQQGVKKAGPMDNLYEVFHPRGVDFVGIASARNADQLRQVCQQNEIVWPEILDSGGIASRYHVDPAKPYLLLDQSRSVIASAGSPLEIEKLLQTLTAKRRVSP